MKECRRGDEEGQRRVEVWLGQKSRECRQRKDDVMTKLMCHGLLFRVMPRKPVWSKLVSQNLFFFNSKWNRSTSNTFISLHTRIFFTVKDSAQCCYTEVKPNPTFIQTSLVFAKMTSDQKHTFSLSGKIIFGLLCWFWQKRWKVFVCDAWFKTNNWAVQSLWVASSCLASADCWFWPFHWVCWTKGEN